MEIKELAKFIEEAVTNLRNGGEGTWYKQLGGKLYCVIGNYDDNTVLGKIAVNSDDLQADYDWDWTMPYYEDSGDVWDTEVEISDNDWEMYAQDFLTQYEELSKINIASDGRILEVPESDYYTLTYYYGDINDIDNSDTETYDTWEETKAAFESQESRKNVKALVVRDEDDNVVKVWKAVGENKKPRKQRKLTENMDSLERLFVDFLNSTYYVDKTDDYFTYTYYADYNDELGAEQVAEILESDSPLETFYDKLNEFYYDSDDYARDEIKDGFKDYLKSHNAEVSEEEFEDRFNDMLMDYVSFTPDYDHFLRQDFECRIGIDTGDSNYDYTLNPSYYNGNIGANPEGEEKGIDKPASLVWLAETQGYSLEQLRKALAEGDVKDPQGFLQSVRQEAQNMSSHMAQLVFLCTASLSELLDWHADKTALSIPRDIDCGLFDKWNGGGSVLEIQLEKPITIPAEYIKEFTPDVSTHYTYGVNDVYGLTAECYRARVKQETGAQETIKESIWNTDLDTDNIRHLSKEQIERISNHLSLNDNETIVDAYYLDKQLHIIIDDGDSETDYIPSGNVGDIDANLEESLLQDLHDDHEHIRKMYGQEVYDALDEYVALGNDLGNVMYNEEKWDEFEAWLRKEKGIEPKIITTESAVNGAFYGRQDIRNITVEPGYHEWVLKVDGKDYYSFGDITSQFENETNPDKASDIAADMIDAFVELEEQYYNDENAEDTFSFFEGAKEIGALCADEVDSARIQLDNVLRDYLSGGLLLSEAKKTKKPFNPTKLLKEGAGAGYHIEGKLSDIKLNSIKSVETFEGKSAFGTDATFAKLIVDADAIVNGSANSYYYGGAINNAKVKITSFEVNPNLLYHIGLDEFEYSSIREEDFQDRIGYGSEIAFKSKTIGGGWSHIDFDGTVEASIDDDYHSYLDGVEFYFVNKGDIEYINHVVQYGEEDLEEDANEVDEFVQLLHSEIDNLRELGHNIKEPDEAMIKQLADELERESVNCEYNDEITDCAVDLILKNLASDNEEKYDNDMGTFGESYLKEGYYDDEPDHFTPEEQEEYGIDEEGNSLDTYDRFRHCAFCGNVVADYKKELDMGYLCHNCIDAIKSRGEKLKFEESIDTVNDTINIDNYRNTNTNKEPLKKDKFVIEDGEVFEGYNEEYSWNGWECPWFTKEVGEQIANYYKGYMSFDSEKDAFVFNSPQDEAETDYFVGEDIETVDGTKHLYPIGNKSWIWDKYQSNEDLEEAWTTFEFEEGNSYIAKTEEEKQRLLKKYGDKAIEIKPGFYKVDNKTTDNFVIEESAQPIDLVKVMKEDPDVTEYIAHSGKKCYKVAAPLQWYFLMCSRAGIEPKWTGDLTYEAKGDGFEFEWVEEDVILALDN